MDHAPAQKEQTLAVLFGASKFPKAKKLAQGRAFYHSAEDFYDYLVHGDGMALPECNVLNFFDDSRSAIDQLTDARKFLERRLIELSHDNTPARDLLIYYVGHGLFAGNERSYCLATRATDEELEGLTSVKVVDLAAMIRSVARQLRTYIILDCCFSAAAYREFQSGPLQAQEVKLREQLIPSRGVALLCSASAHDVSLAPTGLGRTMFSDSLLKMLNTGNESFGEFLTLSDLGYLVSVDLRSTFRDDWVRPEVHSPDQREGEVAGVALFPNRAHLRQPPPKTSSPSENEIRKKRLDNLVDDNNRHKSSSYKSAGNEAGFDLPSIEPPNFCNQQAAESDEVDVDMVTSPRLNVYQEQSNHGAASSARQQRQVVELRRGVELSSDGASVANFKDGKGAIFLRILRSVRWHLMGMFLIAALFLLEHCSSLQNECSGPFEERPLSCLKQ